MTARPKPSAFAFDAFLLQQQQKSLLRFLACGSVDDGKSTLIGRLLYETKALFEDQLRTLKLDSRKWGTNGGALDFALLTDGLAAEREQGITIDVAYRYFTTDKRKFIVADTPGHEQYTRNMATGASTADLAVILIDARKGLTQQARRHSLIVSMLGVRHVVIAVNKMDLVGWARSAFDSIEAEYRAFARRLDIREIVCIPTAARNGDNVIDHSQNMDWYQGPTLLEHLEEVDVEPAAQEQPFRMPVQLVTRPNADFRGYAGLITSGTVAVGDPVRAWPAGGTTRVSRIVTFDGDLVRASSGQNVVLTFADEIDVSRGDIVAGQKQPPLVSDRISTRIFWMHENALMPGRLYLLKIGTQTAVVTASTLHAVDLDTLELASVETLPMNAVGDSVLQVDRVIAVDRYDDGRGTGNFILIDRETYDTVGMGLVLGGRDGRTGQSA